MPLHHPGPAITSENRREGSTGQRSGFKHPSKYLTEQLRECHFPVALKEQRQSMVGHAVNHPGCFGVSRRAPSYLKGGGTWTRTSTTCSFFEIMSKRRKGFPPEAKVKRGVRIVHGSKELSEKLGRKDLCPCKS